jgi:hypothetical protein
MEDSRSMALIFGKHIASHKLVLDSFVPGDIDPAEVRHNAN